MRYNHKCYSTLTLLVILLFVPTLSFAASDRYSGISPNISAPRTFELETKLIEAFNKNQCADIPSIASYEQYNRTTALSLAIIAYCTTDSNLSEKIFAETEERDPHLEYLSPLRSRKAEKLYVPWSYYLIPQLGVGYESNPLLVASPSSSLESEAQISTGFQRRLSFGVLSANYTSVYRSNA